MAFTQFPIPTITVTDWGLPYNILDYGAVSGGVVDNAAAFLAAITAASATGGTVMVPPGTWALASQVLLANNVYLKGAGPGATVLKLTTAAYASNLIQCVGCSRFGVSDLTIDVNNNLDGVNAAIGFGLASDWVIDNVEILHQVRLGISFSQSTRFRISNCKISKDTALPTLNQSILGNTAIGTNSIGQIINNFCINTGMLISANNLLVAENHITGTGFGSGIAFEDNATDCYNIQLLNNICIASVGIDENATIVSGIEIWAPNSLVLGNECYNNAGTGLNAAAPNSIYANNLCYDNSRFGAGAPPLPGIGAIYLDANSNCNNSLFIGNRCFDTLGAGGYQSYGYAEVSASLDGLVLSGNDFAGNKTGTVSILSSTTINGDLQAWADYTSTVTATSGTLTSVSGSGRWTRFNKTVSFNVVINLTTNGTGAGAIRFTLPVATSASTSINIFPSVNSTSGLSGRATVATSSLNCDVVNNDGTYPGADGVFLFITGTYESAT